MSRAPQEFVGDERASELPVTAILVALGSLIGLAVLVKLGPALYEFFVHIGQCLNGC